MLDRHRDKLAIGIQINNGIPVEIPCLNTIPVAKLNIESACISEMLDYHFKPPLNICRKMHCEPFHRQEAL